MVPGICDLPPELLAAVFKEGQNIIVEDEARLARNDPNARSPRTMPFEILATHICATFRQISLTTPSLWSTIHVYAGCRVDEIVDRLGRSGACELLIRLESGVQDPPIDPVELDIIVEYILNESARWSNLFLRYAYELQAHPVVARICSGFAPKLRLLSLTVDDVSEAGPGTMNRSVNLPHIFINGQSQPNFVRLRGLAIHFFRPRLSAVVTLHLDQLRHLVLQYSTLRQILTCSPYLANLSIYGDILPPGSWLINQQYSIHIPNLRSLRLFSESGETYSGLLEGLDAPLLQSLTLKSLQEHDLDAFWDIPNLSPRFSNLASLNFTEFDFTGITYNRIFQTFRDITTFTALCAPVADSPLLQLLSQGVINDLNGLPYTPWPFLQTLGFAADFWGDDEGVIDAVVEARKTCGHPLSTFLFAIDSDEQVEAELALEYQSRPDLCVKFCGETLVWPEDCIHLDHEDNLF